MKKYIWLIVALLCIPALVYGWGVLGMSGQTVAGGVTCLSGTYAFHWDGDYDDDELTACIDDGGDTLLGSQVGGDLGNAYGESGSVGFMGNANGEYLDWAKATAAGNAVTIFTRFKVVTVTDAATSRGTGINNGINNYLVFRWGLDLGFYGNGTIDTIFVSQKDTDYTRNAWHTAGITYHIDQGNDDFCTCYDADCGTDDWTCDIENLASGWGTAPNEVRVGDNDDGKVFSDDDEVYIDKLLIINSWQGSEIAGW
jgi:hypothetical protein